MISQKKIIDTIDKADIQFSWCYENLENLRSKKTDEVAMFEFQTRLCKAFVILDRIYRAVISEENHLIFNKDKYAFPWFRSRMQKLATYKKAILKALSIGRNIGDAFAWIFYQEEVVLIEEHAKEQRQALLPPKIGGVGERAFVEKLQGLGGTFILYHGITSFLRLGDVSFFDPRTARIAALGELKTKQISGERYLITLGLVGDSKVSSFAKFDELEVHIDAEESHPVPLDEHMKRKLNEQLDSITDVLRVRQKRCTDPKSSNFSKFHFNELEKTTTQSKSNKFRFQKVGNGLLIGGWRPRIIKSLGKRILREHGNTSKILLPVNSASKEILSPDINDNCLFFGSIPSTDLGHPIFNVGSTPLFWWPIDRKAIKDIIFEKVILITILNPAHLWSLLRKNGYDIKLDEKSRVISAQKNVDGKQFIIRNFQLFQDLVQFDLMDEKSVIGIINSLAEIADEQSKGKNIKVELRLNIRF